jgi:hypothetical protein
VAESYHSPQQQAGGDEYIAPMRVDSARNVIVTKKLRLALVINQGCFVECPTISEYHAVTQFLRGASGSPLGSPHSGNLKAETRGGGAYSTYPYSSSYAMRPAA